MHQHRLYKYLQSIFLEDNDLFILHSQKQTRDYYVKAMF